MGIAQERFRLAVYDKAVSKSPQPARGRPEAPGYRNDIARLGRIAGQEWSFAIRASGHGHRDEERGGADDIAADNRAAIRCTGGGYATVHLLQTLDGQVAAKAEAYDGVHRHAAHGCDIALVGGHQLPAQGLPARPVQGEMHPFDHRVGGEDRS